MNCVNFLVNYSCIDKLLHYETTCCTVGTTSKGLSTYRSDIVSLTIVIAVEIGDVEELRRAFKNEISVSFSYN